MNQVLEAGGLLVISVGMWLLVLRLRAFSSSFEDETNKLKTAQAELRTLIEGLSKKDRRNGSPAASNQSASPTTEAKPIEGTLPLSEEPAGQSQGSEGRGQRTGSQDVNYALADFVARQLGCEELQEALASSGRQWGFIHVGREEGEIKYFAMKPGTAGNADFERYPIGIAGPLDEVVVFPTAPRTSTLYAALFDQIKGGRPKEAVLHGSQERLEVREKGSY